MSHGISLSRVPVGAISLAATLLLSLVVSCGTGSGFCFSPGSATITVGTPVAWTNTTAAPHTATADGGTFDTSTVNPGQTTTITFSSPGRAARTPRSRHCWRV